jgi:hypothetical protein
LPRRNPFSFIRGLRRLLRERGPYDAIHCHIHAYSGFAGLPCIISDGIPPEAVITPEVVARMASTAGALAAIALEQAHLRDPGRAQRAFEILENSSFNVAVNMKALAALYRSNL